MDSEDQNKENKDDQLFVYKLFGISTPRLIKARSSLRQKIGLAETISESQILRAQYLVDQSKVNFTPYIMEHVAFIMRLIALMREDDYAREDHYSNLIRPIVQIKGQAAMFGNPTASNLSEKLLIFMEQYKRLDNDVLDILNVYCKVIDASCKDETHGKDSQLIKEMDNALTRYRNKFKKNIEQ